MALSGVEAAIRELEREQKKIRRCNSDAEANSAAER